MSKSSVSNIPGVYMIRNKLNGKVYIGQSKNIRKRFSQYHWAVNSDSDYNETKHPITLAMKEIGIENFEFTVLYTSKECEDPYVRTAKEIELIAKYRSTNPKYGYNEDRGGDVGHLKSRPQSFIERMKRAKPIYRYDTKTGGMLLYFGGAKAVGDDMGYSKDVMSHTVKRACLLENRYYLIPVDRDERKKQVKRIEDSTKPKHLVKAYKQACDIVDNISKITFGI